MKKLFIIFFLVTSFSIFAAENKYDTFADKSYRQLDNSLAIHIIPSTYRLEWTTAKSLLFSIAKNKYYFPKTNHFIGHVSAEINCSINGKKERFFMGQSSASLDGFRNYLLKGYGFSILNQPKNNYDVPLLTVKGKLDSYKGSSKHFSNLIDKENFGLLAFKIPQELCEKTYNYMKTYQEKTEMTELAGNNYGFGADPKTFEGAGCAPFVQTVLDYAGVKKYAEIMDQTVYIPKAYVGNPKKGHKVGLWKLLTSDFNMNNESKDSLKFDFPDPQNLADILWKIKEDEYQTKYPVLAKDFIDHNVPYVLLDSTVNNIVLREEN